MNVSPIQTLPTELLAVIFLHLCSSGTDWESPTIRLTAVCRRWTQIANSVAALWSSVALFSQQENRLKVHLERSKTQPLELQLVDLRASELIPLVFAHANRIRSLYVQGTAVLLVEWMEKMAETEFPLLRSLSLHATAYDKKTPQDLDVVVPDVILTDKTPILVDFILNGIDFKSWQSFRGLEKISLIPRTYGRPRVLIPLPDALDVLDECPNLRILKLQLCLEDVPLERKTPHGFASAAPHVLKLDIVIDEESQPGVDMSFRTQYDLASCDCRVSPLLLSFLPENKNKLGEMLQLVLHNVPTQTLTHLSISNADFSMAAWKRLLVLLPALNAVTINVSAPSHRFFQAAQQIVPNLPSVFVRVWLPVHADEVTDDFIEGMMKVLGGTGKKKAWRLSRLTVEGYIRRSCRHHWTPEDEEEYKSKWDEVRKCVGQLIWDVKDAPVPEECV
ncbi:Carboxypeptidase [Mycena chlorophos]|uniref:Carboxypeptidase n=1 Tax=Mycena chlorophos TaxID=658473 RepID=A0A8H6S2Y4_MYCCL|nr:Carboxypeptidase [Mycena chlorophos]